jgi:phosphoadenosine phosphosulfate reductase
LEDFLRDFPVDALTARGYRSVGCQPYNRPPAKGENERAGRWSGFDKSECGIHTFLGSDI